MTPEYDPFWIIFNATSPALVSVLRKICLICTTTQELLSRLHLPLVNQLKLYVPDMDEPSEEEEEANGEE